MECEKCYLTLYKCEYCDGQTRTSLLGDRLTCRTCNSTGWLCRTHEGHWQR
jgi:hypothetical protein